MSDKILVPRKEFLKGEEFYETRMCDALESMRLEGYQQIFMPQLVDTKIEAPKDARIWQKEYVSPSVAVTGRTKRGNPVVIYAHVPNHLSNPVNLMEAINREKPDPSCATIPMDEFYRLLELEDDKDVFVVDFKKLKKSFVSVLSLDEFIDNPQTIPFLGGEARAEAYMKKHKEFFGDEIRISHVTDYEFIEDQPSGRLLYLGLSSPGITLCGNYAINFPGRFIGVKKQLSEGIEQRIK
ncbi:hypothetical protein HOC13_00450 [Candidatus Woesearchaeota archaeon]|jgi:hypothetical protein|nr:hypothetical protein [Candidatus Woesearchaeota archaeon]